MPDAVITTTHHASRLRTIRLLRDWWRDDTSDRAEPGNADARTLLAPEVKAKLDEGLAAYTRDDGWRRGVIEHYRFNLGRMADLARQRGVAIVLVDPASNLRDCPPFKSEPTEGLDAVSRARVAELVDNAHRLIAGNDTPSATDALADAVELDPRNASLWFDLAKSYDAVGRIDDAGRAYRRAKEEDVCPLRAIDPFSDAVREIADAADTIVVNARDLLARHSRDGIPGDDVFVDHVHPSIHSHKLIATEIARVLTEHSVVTLDPSWRDRAEPAWAEHEASLSPLYYERGMRALTRLNAWARDRWPPDHMPSP